MVKDRVGAEAFAVLLGAEHVASADGAVGGVVIAVGGVAIGGFAGKVVKEEAIGAKAVQDVVAADFAHFPVHGHHAAAHGGFRHVLHIPVGRALRGTAMNCQLVRVDRLKRVVGQRGDLGDGGCHEAGHPVMKRPAAGVGV